MNFVEYSDHKQGKSPAYVRGLDDGLSGKRNNAFREKNCFVWSEKRTSGIDEYEKGYAFGVSARREVAS